MKKVLSFVILIFCFFLCSCNKVEMVFGIAHKHSEYGDFYYRVQTDNSKSNNDGDDNEKKSSKYVRITGLTEQGRKKKYLIFPKEINGIEVKFVGGILADDMERFESDVLEKVYIPYYFESTLDWWGVDYIKDCPIVYSNIRNKLSNLKKIISNIRLDHYRMQYQTPGDLDMFIMSIDYYKTMPRYREFTTFVYYANVSFMYNYEDAPNYGYYWIDDFENGTLIDFIPDDPKRDGYIFAGWYKDVRCINRWDFDVDLIQKYKNYNETRLYAKWIECDKKRETIGEKIINEEY